MVTRMRGGRLGRGATKVGGRWAGGGLGRGAPKAPQAPRPGGPEMGWATRRMFRQLTPRQEFHYGAGLYPFTRRGIRQPIARTTPTPTTKQPGWKQLYQGWASVVRTLRGGR